MSICLTIPRARILKATSTNHNWGENVTNPAGSQYETEKVWMDNLSRGSSVLSLLCIGPKIVCHTDDPNHVSNMVNQH